MKTGVQAILNGLKILDSGFCRNDGKRRKPIFSQPPPSRGRGFLSYFNMFTLSPRGRGQGEGRYSDVFTPSPIGGVPLPGGLEPETNITRHDESVKVNVGRDGGGVWGGDESGSI